MSCFRTINSLLLYNWGLTHFESIFINDSSVSRNRYICAKEKNLWNHHKHVKGKANIAWMIKKMFLPQTIFLHRVRQLNLPTGGWECHQTGALGLCLSCAATRSRNTSLRLKWAIPIIGCPKPNYMHHTCVHRIGRIVVTHLQLPERLILSFQWVTGVWN